MSWKLTVSKYVMHEGRYDYVRVYEGQSFSAALVAAWKAKRSGAGCVRVEWR